MELSERHVLVIGAGCTGRAVSRVLAARGARVVLADRRPQGTWAQGLDTLGHTVELRLGEDGLGLLAGADLVVPSPGVPATTDLLVAAVGRKLPVMSEIEVAARLLECPVLAVTGTNGKSTTTTLIGEMLRAGGARAFMGGNLGVPLIEAVEGAWEVAVAEVSSFQLEWVEQFRPAIGVLLNISPDHLDRHGSMAAYVAAKARLFAAQRGRDVAVLNRDDAAVWQLRSRLRGRVVAMGGCPGDGEGTFVRNGHIVCRDAAEEVTFPLECVRLQGSLNLENMMAAVSVARLYGVAPEPIQSVLERFVGLPHRCVLVREAGGVRYYDDSKATNVGAVIKSLHGFPERVILVAGGLDKGADFTGLRPVAAGRVRLVVAYGAAAHQIADALAGAAPVQCVGPFGEAVQDAMRAAKPGDTVLLAPGCTSFDQFADYAERGRAFQALVSGPPPASPDMETGGCQ
jgi:UDP-N-acetylmuramoylalanine--D-glutamate ligase